MNVENSLLWVSRQARQHSNLVLALSFLLFGLSLFLAYNFLDFQTDRKDLIGSNDALFDDQSRFVREFPVSDDVVVVVEGGNQVQREAFVELLAGLLTEHPNRYEAVFPKIELPFLKAYALQHLPEAELENLVMSVEKSRPMLLALGGEAEMGDLFTSLIPKRTSGEGSGGRTDSSSLDEMLPVLHPIIVELERAIKSRGTAQYRSPWSDALFGEEVSSGEFGGSFDNTTFYHTLDQGRVHLLLLRLKQGDPESIAHLRELTKVALRAYPSLHIGLTGDMILEHDETISSERDSHRSALFSILMVALLFTFSFRQVARPLAAIYCLMIAVGWTVGFTTLAIGHLNLLTISFATILIGLGIDFGIHLLFRYEEEFQKTGDPESALDLAVLGTGSDILVGAVSTATAFWAVGLTEFKGVSEIGIIAGTGVIFCLLSTLIVLPALLYKLDRSRQALSMPPSSKSRWVRLGRAEQRMLTGASWTIVATVMFLCFAFPKVWTVGFDYNLLRLQDQRLESVKAELKLIERGGKTVLFAVSLAEDIEQAKVLKGKFESLPAVARVESVSDLFPEHTPTKRELLKRLKESVSGIELSEDTLKKREIKGEGLQNLGTAFLSFNKLYDDEKERILANSSTPNTSQVGAFDDSLQSLYGTLADMGPGPIEDGLSAFQRNFFNDLDQMLGFLQIQEFDQTLTLEQLPPNLRLRSVGKTGQIALRIYPKDNIWERPAMERFVSQVRSAQDGVVGAPVLILHHTSLLKGAFESSGLYALAAVSLILLLYFRSLKWAFLAFVPLALGVFFMLFCMAMAGVQFNPANFMGLPLLLGIGLDFGIHVLHRAQKVGRVNMFDNSTGPATGVSALTTICGFGTLAMGGHQGVASLGFVLGAGVTGIALSSLVILPAFLKVSGILGSVDVTPSNVNRP